MGVRPKLEISIHSHKCLLSTHYHLSKHTIADSDSDIAILKSGNSNFDLEMRESLLSFQIETYTNNNISSMPLYLF